MLKVTVLGVEYFDDGKQEFVTTEDFDLELEHSLVSLSKWESEWETPFLGPGNRTFEELFGYVKSMTLTPDVPEEVYARLSNENFEKINAYINAKMTATWFGDDDKPPSNREVVTSELIYYWMTALSISWEAENWHLMRLLTLIKVCSAKNSPPKKLSASEMAARRQKINEANKKRLGTKG